MSTGATSLDLVNEVPPESNLNKLGSQIAVPDKSPAAIARENWRRYEYVRSRGHVEYCAQARRNEDFYLGGGFQWAQDVKQYMEQVQGRPAAECNEIMGAVNAALGYQIANRMDIQFVPRNSQANPATAKALDQVFKQIMDYTKYKWHETQVCGDGYIAQRGFFDLRIIANDNMESEVSIFTPDPMDVIPDPDAKSYDTADWLDVTVTRWLTGAEIGDTYGAAAEKLVVSTAFPREGDFGDGIYDDGIWRNRFGDWRTTANEFTTDLTDGSDIRYRIIDRQHHRHDWSNVAIYPTGEIIDISSASPDELNYLQRSGIPTTIRRIKRVRWTVSACQDVLITDDWSPFSRFTIVPFFPYFRRGKTRGMVDNAISPQETLNKAISQAVTITNTTANSGWLVPRDTLKNISAEQLEEKGASSGLIIEFDPKIGVPTKIEPNPVPTGITNLITVARENIKAVTGINESMLGIGPQDMSGIAIQSRQYAAQQGLALPLDNLSRTRSMMANIILEYIQKFMPDEREVRVTSLSPMGIQQKSVMVNQVQPDGSILHDLTLGKYDVVITDQPMQITFDNSQFEQIKSLHETFGYNIPPAVALRYSNLPDKAEIAPLLEQANSPAPDPMQDAKVQESQAAAALKQAQADSTKAKTDQIAAQTVQTKVTAMYEATQAAAQAAAVPGVAASADSMLASAGFTESSLTGPIPVNTQGTVTTPVPPLNPGTPNPGNVPGSTTLPRSTHPNLPAHPDVGAKAGIEGGQT